MMGDDAVLAQLGERLAQRRIDLGLTQAALAKEAGVSKRTVERIERGGSAQMLSVVRLLRVLDLLGGMDRCFPKTGPRPLDLVRRKGKIRRRASGRRNASTTDEPWSWET